MANKNAMIAHGLSTKFLPLYFTVIAFLFISDYTRNTLAGIDPTDFFLSSILFFAGLVFIYEGFNNIPKRGTTIGNIGFVFFFIVAFMNIIYAIFIFNNSYDPLNDNGDINFLLQVVLGVDIIMLFIQGIYEVIISKRFVVEKVF